MKRQQVCSTTPFVLTQSRATERVPGSCDDAPLYCVPVEPGSLEEAVIDDMVEHASQEDRLRDGCHIPRIFGYNRQTGLIYYHMDLACLKAYHVARSNERWWRHTPLRQRWQRTDEHTLVMTAGSTTLHCVGLTPRQAYDAVRRAYRIVRQGREITLGVLVNDVVLRGLTLDQQLAHEDGHLRYWLTGQVLRDGMDRLPHALYMRVFKAHAAAQEFRTHRRQTTPVVSQVNFQVQPGLTTAQYPAFDETEEMPAIRLPRLCLPLYRVAVAASRTRPTPRYRRITIKRDQPLREWCLVNSWYRAPFTAVRWNVSTSHCNEWSDIPF